VRNFILVHGPLVGAFTWVPVSQRLRELGATVVLPALTSPGGGSRPFWQEHRDQLALQLKDIELDIASAVLVAHDGAGPLLPELGRALDVSPGAYILVDSDLPRDGASRFDLFADQADVERFREAAVSDGQPRTRQAAAVMERGPVPPSDRVVRGWPEDLLATALAAAPDESYIPAAFAGRRATPVTVYDEPLPVPADWPERPAGYLHLSGPYAAAAAEARERAWPVRDLPSGHFGMLVDPEGVARELVSLADQLLDGSSA